MQQQSKTSKLTILAMLSALAYLVMVIGRIPVVLFLKYDPKDVIIVIGGFLFGPLSAFAITVIVSFVEMFTVSSTGWIGLIMNIISSCAFACTAAFIYKKNRNMKGAVTGLIAGGLFMTVVMLLWNYLIVPIYMGMPREAVAELLLPAFLPFNLLKAALNIALTLLLYKPVTNALRKSRLMPPAEDGQGAKGKINVGVAVSSAFLILSCVLLILVWQGKL